MNPLFFFPALTVGILGSGAYRYSLVYDVLQQTGTSGITVFTALLFLPALSARAWADRITGKGRSWLAIICGILFTGLALYGRPKPWFFLASQALLLGMMESLLIPAVQAWSARRSEGGLAWANSAIFLVSCLSLLLAPAIGAFLGADRVSIAGVAGYSLLCVLLLNLPKSAPALAVAAQSKEAPAAADGLRGIGVVFLAGAAFGALSNMIYPIALKMLDGKALTVGLATSAPFSPRPGDHGCAAIWALRNPKRCSDFGWLSRSRSWPCRARRFCWGFLFGAACSASSKPTASTDREISNEH
ncbi:MAG: hypothetical protein M0D55_04470 [Elusimicrobiota bacterium]|nr:MAG: hypothetical protein M0D55_04470 [Elusimicrobiota bacterium]